jgi:hypothetical protein
MISPDPLEAVTCAKILFEKKAIEMKKDII